MMLRVIKSFADRDTERLFYRQTVRSLPADLRRMTLRKLLMLDGAMALEELRLPPGNRLEALRGNRAGSHSIRINDQWRIYFVWHDGDAYEVEVVDYHKG